MRLRQYLTEMDLKDLNKQAQELYARIRGKIALDDPVEIVKKAKELVELRKEEEKKFKESVKKASADKSLKRIKFLGGAKNNWSETTRGLMAVAISIYEKVLKIPADTKYKITLQPMTGFKSVSGEAAGAVYVSGKNVDMKLANTNYTDRIDHYFDMLESLAHEMIHVEQSIVKKEKHYDQIQKYKYEDRPFEKDAFKRQNAVFRQFLTMAEDIYFGRELKIENGKLWQFKAGRDTGFDLKKHYPLLKKETPELSFHDLDFIMKEWEWVEI